jgi:hypothetical protein
MQAQAAATKIYRMATGALFNFVYLEKSKNVKE